MSRLNRGIMSVVVHKYRFTLILLSALLTPPAQTRAERRITLQSKQWVVSISPETLHITVTPSNTNSPFILSAAQPKPLPIGNLSASENTLSWELTTKKTTLSLKLEEDTLIINIKAKIAGEFTFPIVPPQTATKAYILPIGEGCYAPTQEANWREYLVKQGGLSTTDGLYLPLWGVDTGGYTLTYIATNPFNNEISFQNSRGSLGLTFTHHFTPHWKVKEYGFRISLGSPSPIEPAKRYREWLKKTGQFVSMQEKMKRTPNVAKLLGASHIYLWGDGISAEMMEILHAEGFDRLWLGADGWNKLRDKPSAIAKAKEFGYLIAPYDSYHSIHSPDAKPDDTWETAQFDKSLYETGSIVRWDGTKRAGFQKKGYLLSPLVAQPYVEKRVSRLMKVLQCNAWFIDCDAFGEVFEDYSPKHPANQQEDMTARLKRMAWIRDTYRLVIGSEGGSAYSAATIHFAHGMMTGAFGFGDSDLTNPASPYFLGRYAPDKAPAVFFKQVLLKPYYFPFYIDPRYRLPLFQTVFHDSVITTHHWSAPTLKFKDQIANRALLELLYSVPPLYHLNQKAFEEHKAWMKTQYLFFSPLHKATSLLPLSEFAWLTSDHQVQRTQFGGNITLIANFRAEPFPYKAHKIPSKSILWERHDSGESRLYTP